MTRFIVLASNPFDFSRKPVDLPKIVIDTVDRSPKSFNPLGPWWGGGSQWASTYTLLAPGASPLKTPLVLPTLYTFLRA